MRIASELDFKGLELAYLIMSQYSGLKAVLVTLLKIIAFYAHFRTLSGSGLDVAMYFQLTQIWIQSFTH